MSLFTTKLVAATTRFLKILRPKIRYPKKNSLLKFVWLGHVYLASLEPQEMRHLHL
jgi:hypothetical protein